MDPPKEIEESIERNKMSALALALLIQERSSFTLLDLFVEVAQLSYYGDIRMEMKAENPNKVKNIVEPNLAHFFKYYEPQLCELEDKGVF